MHIIPLLLTLGLTLTACGDKDDGGDGTTTGPGTDGGGTSDGGSSDGGSGDGGSGDGGSGDGGSGDGGTTAEDVDGDGFTVADGDCDDSDPGVYPGAPDEPYDGLDSDCDGASDYDWDGDGYDSDEHGGDDCDDADDDVHPGAVDAPYDGLDQDCGGDSDFDADGDGSDSDSWGGDDCNDEDPDFGPDAYDRPNDDLDQDCDGSDRSFDGVVLDEGGTATWEIEVALVGYGSLDVAVLLDTTCSMSTVLNSLDFDDIADELTGLDADISYGFATYDDYYYGSFGSSVDRPFILRQQMTADLDALQDAVDDASIHGGSDGPEASIEGLYQALSGIGYDQDCDGEYDSTTDVLPFLASAGDPFGGAGGEAGDADTALGTVGGMGFREGSTPIVFYITDAYLRDADGLVSSFDSTPGGCPGDAGSEAVADLTTELEGWLYGIATATTPLVGMEELADMSGSMLDLDGDGEDDPLVQRWSSSSGTLGTFIGEQLAAISDSIVSTPIIGTIELEPTLDAYGLIIDISPDPASDVDTSTTDSVTFTITLEGSVPATTSALDVTLMLDLLIEGEVVDTYTVLVEIPPA